MLVVLTLNFFLFEPKFVLVFTFSFDKAVKLATIGRHDGRSNISVFLRGNQRVQWKSGACATNFPAVANSTFTCVYARMKNA